MIGANMNTPHYKKNSPAGFTLLEMIVSIGIFIFVLLSVSGIFQHVLRAQMRAFAAQDIEESIRFAFEIMSKEIRTAERNFSGECADIPDGAIYAVSNGTLYVQNQNDDCVAYYRQADAEGVNRLYISRTDISAATAAWPITPNDIEVESLDFVAFANGQPAVQVRMAVSALDTRANVDPVYLQTAISSRYYLEGDID